MSATSSYGYLYSIDFSGEAVRGDMDMRLLTARKALDNRGFASGGSEVVFTGLGDIGNVKFSLSSDLDNATFMDAIVKLR